MDAQWEYVLDSKSFELGQRERGRLTDSGPGHGQGVLEGEQDGGTDGQVLCGVDDASTDIEGVPWEVVEQLFHGWKASEKGEGVRVVNQKRNGKEKEKEEREQEGEERDGER